MDGAKSQILQYQSNRTLDQVPGYPLGLQFQLSTGSKAYVALSSTELSFYFDADFALHYDLAARLTRVAHTHEYWRRALSHRVLYSRKRTEAEGGGLDREVLSETDADTVVSNAHQWAALVHSDLQSGTAKMEFGKPNLEEALAKLGPLVARAAQFDLAASRADAARFTKIYGRVAVLPSDQYNALVLQATEGCGFGGCSFCELYTGVRYHARTPDEFRQHVSEAIDYHGAGLRARRCIYLGEANALHAPQRTLVDNLRFLNEVFQFPAATEQHVPASWWLGHDNRFESIATFLDVFTGEPRSAMDYTELRRLGLRRVYIGMETGCDALLQWLRKPAKQELIHRTVRTLKEADINVGMIILLGAGGGVFHEMHVRETIESLNSLPLGKGDFIYFSPLLIYPGGPYDERIQQAKLQCLTPLQMHGQELEIRAGLKFDERRGKPYLAKYELESFVY
jgi:hypothetical protein